MPIPYKKEELVKIRLEGRGERGIFTGGLNLNPPANFIPDTDSPDLWNVEFTKNNTIRPRPFIRELFSLPDTVKSGFQVKGGFSFIAEDNVAYVVVTDNEDVFISSDNGNTWTKINSTSFNNSYKIRMVYINNKLFGTNGVNDVWYYDLATATYNTLPSAPKGRYIAVHNGRIWLFNTPNNANYLYYSRIDDETDFTNPITSATNFIKVSTDKSGFGTGIYSYQGELYIFIINSIFVLRGNDESDFLLYNISKEVGCANAETIREYRGGIIFLANNGNFYKIVDKNLIPIGDKIKPALKNNISQIYTYSEYSRRIDEQGEYKWSDAPNNSYFFVASQNDFEKDSYWSIGFLFSEENGTYNIVPNGQFLNGFDRWNKQDAWYNGSGYTTGTDVWVTKTNPQRASRVSEYDEGNWYSYATVLFLEIVDAVTNETLIRAEKNGDKSGYWYEGANGFVDYTSTDIRYHTINTADPNSYDNLQLNGISSISELRKKRVKIKIGYGRRWITWGKEFSFFGGYTHLLSDEFFAYDRFEVTFRIYTDTKYTGRYRQDEVGVYNIAGALKFSKTTADTWETAEYEVNVDRWGACIFDYDNNQNGDVRIEYSIYDPVTLVWSPYTQINSGDNIIGTTGNGVKIKFRIGEGNPDVNNYGDYYPNKYKYILFYFYQKNSDIPVGVEVDLTSVVYNERYYISLALYNSEKFDKKYNNTMFVYDEFNNIPRWSRYDIKASWLDIYANKIIIGVDNNFGTFDYEYTFGYPEATQSKYDFGISFYYKTKAFDFGLDKMLKRFKFLTIEGKTFAISRNIVNCNIFIDEDYVGTFRIYDIDLKRNYSHPNLTYPVLSQEAKLYILPLITSYRTPYLHEYKTEPILNEDVNKKVIGYGNRIQFEFVLAYSDDPDNRIDPTATKIFPNTTEIENIVIEFIPKDYAFLPVGLQFYKKRSND